MSAIKSVNSLASVLKVKPRISRKHLSRYSWLPDVLRVKGSIAVRIIGPVLTVTVFASAVAYAFFQGHDVTLSNSVTPLLGVVVGLILVFRNGTSYDRYYEGRKDFGAMMSNIRNLSRLIWVTVAVPPESSAAAKGPTLTAMQLRKAKADALRLCVAYAYAVKHRLRNEHGTSYEDYAGILPTSLARYDGSGVDPNMMGSSVGHVSYQTVGLQDQVLHGQDTLTPESGHKISRRASHNHLHGLHFHPANVTVSDRTIHTPLLADTHRNAEFHSYSVKPIATPLPLIIAHELARTVFKFRRDGYLETVGPAGTNTMNTLIQNMVDQLTNLERVANTPIPISYGIHLKQCVSLYLFALPFTLVRDLSWSMIPVVTVVAFTLMGIEGIANEIEMPFGTDDSDLPLDRFCEELKDEMDFMIARLPEGGEGMLGYDDGEGDD